MKSVPDQGQFATLISFCLLPDIQFKNVFSNVSYNREVFLTKLLNIFILN